MSYDFTPLKNKVAETELWLSREFSGIRTGRATPAILDGVSVEVYGVKSPLSHVASISIENARALRIAVWDKAHLKQIETAISGANLGLSVAPGGDGLRVSFPELSTERRAALAKLVREKLETARVSLRGEREHAWNDISKKEKDKVISEDEKFRYKKELEKIVEDAGKKLEELAEKKEHEISS